MRLLHLFIMMQGFCLDASAQTISGRVVDSSGNPLHSVSVSILTEKGRLVSFAYTDSAGRFNMANPEGKHGDRLSFTMLGYSKVTVMISDFANGQDVRLEAEEFTLKEVKVSAEKIRQSGDTLIYSVSAFKQKQDRTIADVIAKMPGLTVMPTGEIRYQGRTINKFYIEGLDLLGSKYAIASENLKADMVQDVQVIEDHQPVKVLKNVNFSDQAALNLVLKEEARNIWQGQIDAGGGSSLGDDTEFLRDAKLLAMLFARKKQSISMYKTNNTGKDIEHELTDQAKERFELRPEESLIEDVAVSTPRISSDKYRFNDTHVVATNWLFKTAKSDDLRFQLNGAIDRSDISGSSEKTIIDAENGETHIKEAETMKSKRNEWSAELTYKANRDSHFFTNTTKGYINFGHSDGVSVFNDITLPQTVKKDKKFFHNRMEWINRLSENTTLSLRSRFIYDDLPSSLFMIDGSRERLSQQKIEWDASTSFRHKLMGIYVTYNAGVSYKRQKMSLHNSIGDGDSRYSQSRVFLGPALSYGNTSLKANATVNFSLLNRQLAGRDKVDFVIEPALFVDYKITGKWSTSVVYSRIFAPTDFADYIDRPVFTNYYTMTKGREKLHNTTLDLVSNVWKFHDTIRGLFGNVSLSYSYTGKIVLYERMFVGGFYTNHATEQTTYNARTAVSGKIGKSIGWGKLSLSLDASLSNNRYQLLVDRQAADFSINSKAAGFSIYYHPCDVFSLEHVSTFNVNDRKSKEISVFDTRQSFFYHNLKFFFLPGHWQIELSNDIFQSSDKSISNSYFADLSVAYRKKTWEAMLLLNNIFGINNMEHIYTSTNQSIHAKSRLRPREILLKLSFTL